MSGFGPGQILAGLEGNGDRVLARRFVNRARERVSHLGERQNAGFQSFLSDFKSVKRGTDNAMIDIGGSEEAFVFYIDIIFRDNGLNILIAVLHLLYLRGRGSVPTVKDTVSAEIAVIWTVVKITAVRLIRITITIQACYEPLLKYPRGYNQVSLCQRPSRLAPRCRNSGRETTHRPAPMSQRQGFSPRGRYQ